MQISGSIGFIGGGCMAEAIIKGLLQAGIVKADHILVADPDINRQKILKQNYAVAVFDKSTDLLLKCDIILLAIKPQIIDKVLSGIVGDLQKRHLVISIAAGITLGYLETKLTGTDCRIIRVMPNTPAIIQQAASALSPSKNVSENDVGTARMIFEAIGSCVQVDENHLDAVTGLSGSGPAYVFLFIEALIDAGVKVGLNRSEATLLAVKTVIGSANLVLASGQHPAQLKANVTSPGGTTIAGLYELEKAGFRGIVMNAVQAATNRSKELGCLLDNNKG